MNTSTFLSLRAKLLAMASSIVLAFALVIVASAVMASRVQTHLSVIQARHIPRLALGPQLDADFTALRRGFQDAVGANDADGLDKLREIEGRLLAAIEGGRDLLGATEATALRTAVVEYYDAALGVSRRMIAKENGEGIVKAIGEMQGKQANAQAVIDRAATVDTRELAEAFAEARAAQDTSGRLRLIVTITCLCVVLALSLWISSGIVRSVQALEAGFERYGRGEFEEPIPAGGGDELAEVASGANRMAERLARLAAERDRAQWVGAGLVGLTDVLVGEIDEAEIATRATRQLARYIGAPAAALYRRDDERTLSLLGHYGLATVAAPAFRIGEGLVGQAAMRQEIVYLDDLPPDYLWIRSGLGESVPRAVALVPLVHHERVIGVLELASFKSWSAEARELFEKASESVGTALEVAHSHAETKALLTRTQEQAQRLATQEEVLRSTNDQLSTRQEELRSTNAELEQQADELDAQRAALQERNDALTSARSRLEKQAHELAVVSAYKSQFLANMSHELRTPLNSMLLLSNLLGENADHNLTDKQVEYAKTVHSSGRDLLALINQVLDLAKVEAGKQEVRIAVLGLHSLAERVRRVFTPLAHERQLALVVTHPERTPTKIATDERLLMQILTNLLGNAIKFTERGEVALHIAERDGLVAFAVSDTGPGIAPADRERIFAPFEQLDASVGRRHGGTGLGLNIAREHARLLGGDLEIESTVGKGSTFTLVLPARVMETKLSTPPSSLRRSPAPRTPSPELGAEVMVPTSGRADCRVLIVEDDIELGDSVLSRLTAEKLDARRVTTAEDAIRLLGADRYACLVLDLALPDMSGLELLEQLQTRKDIEMPAVVVYTARALTREETATLEARADAIVLKDGSSAERLLAEVRLFVDRSKRGLGSSGVATPRRGPGPRLERRKLLVVDDDMRTVYALAAALRAEGAEVLVAENGAVALALLAENPDIAAMLTDVMMPGMDGYQAIRRIRAEARFAHLPIVALTAKAMKGEEARCLEAGATDYLPKPVDADWLVALLHQRISEKAR